MRCAVLRMPTHVADGVLEAESGTAAGSWYPAATPLSKYHSAEQSVQKSPDLKVSPGTYSFEDLDCSSAKFVVKALSSALPPRFVGCLP